MTERFGLTECFEPGKIYYESGSFGGSDKFLVVSPTIVNRMIWYGFSDLSGSPITYPYSMALNVPTGGYWIEVIQDEPPVNKKLSERIK